MLMSLSRRLARVCGQAFGRGERELFEPLENRLVFAAVAADNHTIIRMDTTFGAIVIEMFDDEAPVTVQNFLNYVNSDRLDFTFFHRMVKKTDDTGGIDIIQGGSFIMPDGVTGIPPNSPGSVVTDAPIALEAPPQTGLSNVAGTIAMARTTQPNSATSGFFFNVTANPSFDASAGYAVFGQIVDGLDVLQIMFNQGRRDGSRVQGLGAAYSDLPVTDLFLDSDTQLQREDVIMLNNVTVVDRAGFRTTPGSIVTGAANAANVTFISSIGANGLSQVFTPDGADLWQYTNLSLTTGAPAVTGNLVAFFDPRTGLKSAIGPSATGVILFTEAANGVWSFRNLTTETAGTAITRTLTVFISTDNVAHAAGMTEDGHIVLYRETGTGSAWEFRDVTTQDLQPRGLATPEFVGEITSYVTAWNGLNIAGLDSTGQIQIVWWAPGIDNNLWTTSNLSTITGAPRLTGGLTVYLTSWQATNIVGITEDGNVSVTWWLPSFGGNWNSNDLTSLFSGPKLQASTITSYVTPWGATNVAGLDEEGTLYIYWWTPSFGEGAWVVTNLMAALPADTKPMTGQIMGVTSPSATINLVGSATNGDVMRYYWSASDPNAGWLGDDVSYLSSIS